MEGPHGTPEPSAAPRLSRTPGVGVSTATDLNFPLPGEHTIEVLKELGMNTDAIRCAVRSLAVGVGDEDDLDELETVGSRAKL